MERAALSIKPSNVGTSSSGGGGGDGSPQSAFRPSKSNLYATVKAIFHPSTNTGVTADDNNRELDVAAYVLPASTESTTGGVRNASSAEAQNTSGTAFRAWSASRLIALMGHFRGNASKAQAETGTSTTLLWWSPLRIRQAANAAINALVPAVFRNSNTDLIPRGKLGSGTQNNKRFLRGDSVWAEVVGGEASLMQQLFNGTSTASTAVQRVGAFQVPDNGNVVLLVSVAGMVRFFPGDDLVALRESDAETVNSVTVYSNSNRHFLIKQPTAATRPIRIWIVEDVEAFASIAARFLPTVSVSELTAAIGSSAAQQRRIWTVERVKQTLAASFNPDAFVGVTRSGSSLSFMRQSRTSPVDITLPSGGGGTTVEANPTGSDGANLSRLKVGSLNYNLPVFSPKLIGGANFGATSSAQAGLFRAHVSGSGIDVPTTPAAGELWAVKSTDFANVGGQFYVFQASDLPGTTVEAAAAYASGGLEFYLQNNRSFKIARNAAGKLVVAAENAATDLNTVSLWRWGYEGLSAISSDHNRYIGWSLLQNPTSTEFAAFSTETDDVLAIPSLPAAFTAAGGAFLVIAVPKSHGAPTGFYRSGNPINVIGGWARVTDWTPTNSTPHFVYATDVAQSATSLAGASYRIEYGGSV